MTEEIERVVRGLVDRNGGDQAAVESVVARVEMLPESDDREAYATAIGQIIAETVVAPRLRDRIAYLARYTRAIDEFLGPADTVH